MYLVVDFPVIPRQSVRLTSFGGFSNERLAVIRDVEVWVVETGEEVVWVGAGLVHVVVRQGGEGRTLGLVYSEHSILKPGVTICYKNGMIICILG